MFVLETDRLVIRPWQSDDRAAFTVLMSHPEVTQYVHGGQPYSEAEVEEWFARQARQLAEHGVCMGAPPSRSPRHLAGLAGTQPLGTTGNPDGFDPARDAWAAATPPRPAPRCVTLETLGRPRVVAIIDPATALKRVAARLA
jgi:hypothetical protein